MVKDPGRWAQAYGLSAGSVVDYLLGPIHGQLGGQWDGLLGRLAQASARMARALDAAVDDWVRRHRARDQYVVPGVRWDGFSHPTLFGMVHQQANPVQVERLADDWARTGRELTQRAEELQRSLAALLPYWSGDAAEEAARSVIAAVGWMADVGSTTSAMTDPLQDSAGALRSAQATMPPPPGDGDWLGAAGVAAAAGFAAAGPLGAGVGAVVGGVTSAFGLDSSARELKRRAVQTMQRYEAAAVQVDSTTPRFVDSGVGRIGLAEYQARRLGVEAVAPPADPTVPATTRASAVAPPLSGHGGSGPGGVSWRELTGRAGPGGFLGGAGLLGGPGATGGIAGTAGVVGAGGPGALSGGAGAAGVGAPLLPGAGGRGGDDDAERRRRYPFEEEPFTLGDSVVPPVIGE